MRMPWQRTVALYLNEARFECLRVLRNPEFAVPVIALPIALYLLMGVAMADMRNQPGAHAISDVGVFSQLPLSIPAWRHRHPTRD